MAAVVCVWVGGWLRREAPVRDRAGPEIKNVLLCQQSNYEPLWYLHLFSKKKQSESISVADPDPGSSAFLTPGSGIRNGFVPAPGSRFQNHIF